MSNSSENEGFTKSYSLNDYQADANGFRLGDADPEYAILGLGGEVGELYSLLAKARRDGRKFDHDMNVKKELGDCMWFIAAIAMDHGFSLQEVAETNIYKLNSRRDRGVLQGSGDNR